MSAGKFQIADSGSDQELKTVAGKNMGGSLTLGYDVDDNVVIWNIWKGI